MQRPHLAGCPREELAQGERQHSTTVQSNIVLQLSSNKTEGQVHTMIRVRVVQYTIGTRRLVCFPFRLRLTSIRYLYSRTGTVVLELREIEVHTAEQSDSVHTLIL